MKQHTALNSFLLIDGAQLALAGLTETLPAEPPVWLSHVYDSAAAEVSPLVIDLEVAIMAGDAALISGVLNALRPQLHASLIDTTLSHEMLTQHLRRFIMIRDEDRNGFTLRFADCTVLPLLSAALLPEQWAALAGPIARWSVHGLDGALRTLPPAEGALAPTVAPLVLSDQQLAALAEATAPSAMLAHLLELNHGVALPGSPVEQHRWACEARLLWRSARNADEIVLRWLTSAALTTFGCVLHQKHLPALLESANAGEIRDGLQAIVSGHHAQIETDRSRKTCSNI